MRLAEDLLQAASVSDPNISAAHNQDLDLLAEDLVGLLLSVHFRDSKCRLLNEFFSLF